MAKTIPKTLSDFRALHDPNVVVPNKIRAALASMATEGKEHWEYEADFLKRAGVTPLQLAAFRETFKTHIVETGNSRNAKRVWFADPKTAEKARG